MKLIMANRIILFQGFKITVNDVINIVQSGEPVKFISIILKS
jgi:hypothetical protein